MSECEIASVGNGSNHQVPDGQAATPAGVQAREVVRCRSCNLVQFRTVSDLCRRCDQPLTAPPPPEVPAEPLAGETSAAQRPAASPASDSTAGESRSFALGERLKQLREARGMTQGQIAAKAKVPRTYISRIEHFHLLPGPAVTQRLADALQVGILELIPNSGLAEARAAADEDPFWKTFVEYFNGLRPDQQLAVRTRVRTMLRQNSITSIAPMGERSEIAPRATVSYSHVIA